MMNWTRRTFIGNTAAAAASVALGGSKVERRMKADPVTSPEALILRNPVADYYFKMKFQKAVAVQTLQMQHPCVFEWLPLCSNAHAVFLRGVSVKAKGSEAVLDATTVTVALDGERIVNRLPIRKAATLRGQDFQFEEKRTSLFQALTMEKEMVGMFLPNATRVNVDLFCPKKSEDGGLIVEMHLDMAEYVCIKVPDGVGERHQYRWGWWDAVDAAPKS